MQNSMQIPAADEKRKNFIGGEWTAPGTGQYEPCSNPADTRDVLGHFPRSGAADAKAAVDAAVSAFPGWSQTPGPERGRVLGRAHAILKAHLEVLAEALCREEGKTLGESRGEVMKGLNLLEFYAGEGFRTHGKTLPSETRSILTLTLRQPVGPVALITPWNFPFAIPVWKLAPALVAGCSVVLKPASLTPLCTHLLAEAFALADKLGLPAQALFDISSKSSGQCWSLTSYCPVPGPVPASPANRDYQAGFAAALMLKDLTLAVEAAAAAGAAGVLGRPAQQAYERLCAMGLGSKDFSVAAQALLAGPIGG